MAYSKYNGKLKSWVGIVPVNWLLLRYLFNELNISDKSEQFVELKNKYLNIFTDIVIVLNFLVELELYL